MNRRLALVPLAAVLLLSACSAGGDDDPTISAPAPSAAASTAPSPSPSAAATTAAPSPSVRTIAVTVSGGTVTGTSGREQVALGEDVVIRVTSDVAEEVHVHGYDLKADVAAGGTAEIPLKATIPGGFEVELEHSGKTLFQLRVA